MANRFKTGVAKALTRIQEHAAVDVEYETSNGTVSGIVATLGETEVEEMTSLAVIQGKRRDYILQAADLTIGSSLFEPSEGDRIKETLDSGQKLICKAVSIGEAACFEYPDPFRLMVRVHTIVVEVTDP